MLADANSINDYFTDSVPQSRNNRKSDFNWYPNTVQDVDAELVYDTDPKSVSIWFSNSFAQLFTNAVYNFYVKPVKDAIAINHNYSIAVSDTNANSHRLCYRDSVAIHVCKPNANYVW